MLGQSYETEDRSRVLRMLLDVERALLATNDVEKRTRILEDLDALRLFEPTTLYLVSGEVVPIEDFSMTAQTVSARTSSFVGNRLLRWSSSSWVGRPDGTEALALIMSDVEGVADEGVRYLCVVDQLAAFEQIEVHSEDDVQREEPESRSLAPTYIEAQRANLEIIEAGIRDLVIALTSLKARLAVTETAGTAATEQLLALMQGFNARYSTLLSRYALEAEGPGLQLPTFEVQAHLEEEATSAQQVRSVEIYKVESGARHDDFASAVGAVSAVKAQILSEDPFIFDAAIQLVVGETVHTFSDPYGRPLQTLHGKAYAYAPLDGSVAFSLPKLENLRGRDRALESAKNKFRDYPELIAAMEALSATIQAEVPSGYQAIDLNHLVGPFLLARGDQSLTQSLCDIAEEIIGRGRMIKLRGVLVDEDGVAENFSTEGKYAGATFLGLIPGHPVTRASDPLIVLGDANNNPMGYAEIASLEELQI